MGHQNFFEYQPTKDLNRFLREYGQACLNNTTPAPPNGNTNIIWQTDSIGNLSAYVPTGGSGGGGVNPGLLNTLPFYASAGSVVSGSSLTTNNSGTSLNVPATMSAFQSVLSGSSLEDRNPITQGDFSTYNESSITSEITGSGWSLGGFGGWTVNINENSLMNCAQRGITQLRGGTLNKHAIGDSAGIYHYVRSDGGPAASSDEGVTAATFQSLEPNAYFHGTVSSTSGTGDQAPVFAFASGNAWTTDGAFMLNITKGSIAGNLNGNSAGLLLNFGSGNVGTYLNYLPVTGVTIPISTAVGYSAIGIPDPQVAANNPVLTTVTVTLAEIGGIKKLFTVNSPVWVAGINYPEQSRIVTAVDNGDGTQTLQLKLRNPNSQYIIFQGGIVGNYISFDADIALSGFRTSYFAFGSLTGSDIIYGLQVTGNLSNQLLPQMGFEAAQTTGANSGFHLYPGAEVVCNTDFGFACTLEQNSVAWAATDVVENPHYPVYGGTTLAVIKDQTSVTNPGFGSAIATFAMSGPGVAGMLGLQILNHYVNNSAFLGSGGPLVAPTALSIGGLWNTGIIFDTMPDTGPLILVNNNNPAASDQHAVFQLGYSAGGNLFYTTSTERWAFTGAVDAQNGFYSNHIAGANGTFTTADSKTVTVSGGLITAIV